MSNKLSRREMLERSMLASASALALGCTSQVNAKEEKAEKAGKKVGPNEKLLVCVVGVNGRGAAHYDAFAKNPNTEVAIICDADEKVGHEACEAVAKKQGGRKPQYVQDMRDACLLYTSPSPRD